MFIVVVFLQRRKHWKNKNKLLISSPKFYSFRVDYIEKSKSLQEQLKELKTEIEVMKVEDKRTDLDRFHDENVQRGDNKYSTLRQVGQLSLQRMIVDYFLFLMGRGRGSG